MPRGRPGDILGSVRGRYAMFLIVFPVIAVPGGLASCERFRIEEAERILATGERREATILRKFSHRPSDTKGRSGSTQYGVELEAGGKVFNRRVRKEEWDRAVEGMRTAWTFDPASGAGVSEVERPWRTDYGVYVLFISIGLALVFLLGGGLWQGLPGGAGEAKVRRGGEAERLPENPLLPPPDREERPEWERWLRSKYPPLGFLLRIVLTGVLACGIPLAAFLWVEAVVLVLLLGAYGVVVILLARARGLRRDRLLWRRGREVHAAPLEAKTTGNVRQYEAVFEFDGDCYRLRQRMPIEGDAMRAKDRRLVLLVDPLNPKRATVVPKGV